MLQQQRNGAPVHNASGIMAKTTATRSRPVTRDVKTLCTGLRGGSKDRLALSARLHHLIQATRSLGAIGSKVNIGRLSYGGRSPSVQSGWRDSAGSDGNSRLAGFSKPIYGNGDNGFSCAVGGKIVTPCQDWLPISRCRRNHRRIWSPSVCYGWRPPAPRVAARMAAATRRNFWLPRALRRLRHRRSTILPPPRPRLTASFRPPIELRKAAAHQPTRHRPLHLRPKSGIVATTIHSSVGLSLIPKPWWRRCASGIRRWRR